MVELTDIRGIGEETAKKLMAKGITTPKQLVGMRPEELAGETGFTIKKAKEVINDAIAKTLETEIECKLAEEIGKERQAKTQIIPTGSMTLNQILGGGVRTDSLTGLVGELSSGKTQLSKQLIVNMVNTHHRKGAYVETEPDTFNADRFKEIASGAGYSGDILKEVYVIPHHSIVDAYSQYSAYLRVEQLCEQGVDIGILSVDSFNAKFRSTFTGRESLPDRSREYGRQIGFLQRLASKWNMAIVLTFQVMGIPEPSSQIHEITKSGIKKKASAPDLAMHGLSNWLALEQIGRNSWKAILFDSSYLPRGEAYFSILKEGVRDYIGKLKE